MVAVQSLWIGKLTQLEILCIKSFLKNGIDFYLYTYDKSLTDALPVGTIIKDANEIMEEDLIFKLKESYLPFSDIFRYKLLHDKGGIWVDMDMVCLRPFSKELLDKEYIFASERTIQKGAYRLKQPSVMNINFLKAPQGSPFYKELFKKCIEYQDKGTNKDNLKYMRIARKLIEKYNYEKYILEPYYFNGIDWWNCKELFVGEPKEKYGVPYCDRWEEDGYTLHFWRGNLRKRNIYDNQIDPYSLDSIYAKLLDKYI